MNSSSSSSNSIQRDIDERTNLTGSNKFEMLLFRLGEMPGTGRSELYGINVFKVREIVAMPPVMAMAGAPEYVLGVVNLRGQVIPVIDLAAVVGCAPKTKHSIMLVTEYARTTQAFAVDSVEDIVRLDWNLILSADTSIAKGYVTSIARLDGDQPNTRLAQILDVESILQQAVPNEQVEVKSDSLGPTVLIHPGSMVLAVDDSFVARSMVGQALEALGLPFVMCNNGQEAWDKLEEIAHDCDDKGVPLRSKVAVVLTDLEMPVMDGFTLTRTIKQHPLMHGLPVLIHSSLTGEANENHVRRSGADAYVAKFQAEELANVIRSVLARHAVAVA